MYTWVSFSVVLFKIFYTIYKSVFLVINIHTDEFSINRYFPVFTVLNEIKIYKMVTDGAQT